MKGFHDGSSGSRETGVEIAVMVRENLYIVLSISKLVYPLGVREFGDSRHKCVESKVEAVS